MSCFVALSVSCRPRSMIRCVRDAVDEIALELRCELDLTEDPRKLHHSAGEVVSQLSVLPGFHAA